MSPYLGGSTDGTVLEQLYLWNFGVVLTILFGVNAVFTIDEAAVPVKDF
jgi:hypothetical protein